ncbi:putative flippase GtrA [Saccharothrix tamanrassetensis]|uniref:Putative flippase GtrA n=1 Tax=Saccharothrix tamanrassetensis TaxID=1051531 RepID=A0A841CMZ3_9PSEU|nr:GtrA family protein [Saccharothrix tamanrassetensis]MBB5957457.1 putative flippase GtrA [Saccharothrix tamanrassetensis]
MSIVRKVLALLPGPLRDLVLRHRELLKFLIVGGTCFLVTAGVNYALKFTVLRPNPVTALIIATIVATIVSYALNREWSFHTRGGRERHHEAALFFLISGVGVALNSLPLIVSRYVLGLRQPAVSLLVQEVADFLGGMVLGTLIATVFRWWAFRRWVFPLRDDAPDAGGPSLRPSDDPDDDLREAA